VVEQQVSQVDILPTTLDLLRVPADRLPTIQGRSLFPLIADRPWQERPVYAETYSGQSVSRRYLPLKRVKAGNQERPPALVAIRTSEWKCIWVPEDPRIPTELYHLAVDPEERRNLIAERPDVATELKSHLPRLEAGWEVGGKAAGMSPEEQAMLEDRLRELGYL